MTTPIRHTGSCTANVLCAARLIRHAWEAQQAPGAHPSPASQHVRRHAGGDTSRTSSSTEPAWRPLGAQQLSMKVSAARGLSSSPAMRGRPGRSVQGIWAGIARWHTCSCHALRPRRSETSRNPPLCTFPTVREPFGAFPPAKVRFIRMVRATQALRRGRDGRP